MKPSKKFAELKEGYGVQGMKLDLNLVQCQVLNFHGQELKKFTEDPSKDLIPRGMVEPLIPFLELFKNFQNPYSPDLWKNDDE